MININNMGFEYTAFCETGKRYTNQDVWRVVDMPDSHRTLLVVCDGMGGANGGNVASLVAVGAISANMDRNYKPEKPDSSIHSLITTAVINANALVYQKSKQTPDLAGMGTTMTGFIIRDRATQIGGILAMASSILFPVKHWLMIRFVDLNDIALQSEWMSTDFLLFAAIFLFMMVIPGHILNHKYNK